MKTLKLVILTACVIITNNAFAQYTGTIPALAEPIRTNYDVQQGSNGFIRLINYGGSTLTDKSTYSVAFAGDLEVLRVCQNGTVAVFGNPIYGNASLNFYTNNTDRMLLGTVNTKDEALNLTSASSIRLFPNRTSSSTANFSNTNTTFYTPLTVHTGLNPNRGITFRKGHTGDVLCEGLTANWLRISNPASIAFWSNGLGGENNDPNFMIRDNGNVGIAVPSPEYKLTVSGTVCATNNTIKTGLGVNSNGFAQVGSLTNHLLGFCINGTARNFVDVNHNLYVGLTQTELATITAALKNKFGLFVKKGVLAEDYSIAPISSWSDFVFNQDYDLMPIRDLEQYIDINKHLPNVPSATEISKNGYSQHDMNKVFLQKIEELTLYIIKQEQTIEELKKCIGK